MSIKAEITEAYVSPEIASKKPSREWIRLSHLLKDKAAEIGRFGRLKRYLDKGRKEKEQNGR